MAPHLQRVAVQLPFYDVVVGMTLIHALSFALNKLIKYFLASLKCHLLVLFTLQ